MKAENNSDSASWGGDGCIHSGRSNHFVSSAAPRELDQIFQLWWINTQQNPSRSSAVIGDLECEAGTCRSFNTTDTLHSHRDERKTFHTMTKSASNWKSSRSATLQQMPRVENKGGPHLPFHQILYKLTTVEFQVPSKKRTQYYPFLEICLDRRVVWS